MCDLIPMLVIYILLGQPWLFEPNVQHNGIENTYALMVGEKEVVLKPMTLAEMDKFKEIGRASCRERVLMSV